MEKAKFQHKEDHVKLARFAKAMSHPTRLFILKFLDRCNMCYTGNLVDELPIAQSSVSQHLKELKEAGLIHGFIETPKVYYCINQDNWKLAKNLFKEFF